MISGPDIDSDCGPGHTAASTGSAGGSGAGTLAGRTGLSFVWGAVQSATLNAQDTIVTRAGIAVVDNTGGPEQGALQHRRSALRIGRA